MEPKSYQELPGGGNSFLGHQDASDRPAEDKSYRSYRNVEESAIAAIPDETQLRRAGYRWLQVSAGWFGYSPGRETVGPLETRHAVTAWMWAHYRGETPQ